MPLPEPPPPPRVLKDRIGPFCHDCTVRSAKRAGRIVAIERGPNCERIVGFQPIIGGKAIEVAMDRDLHLYLPQPFYGGQALGIRFVPCPGETVDRQAQAHLIVEYRPPRPTPIVPSGGE